MVQTIITALILGVAILFVVRRAVRRIRDRHYTGCSCCGSANCCCNSRAGQCGEKNKMNRNMQDKLRSGAMMLAVVLSLPALAQSNSGRIPAKYAAGAVPVVDGKVEFSSDYTLPSKSKAQIYEALQSFAGTLVKGENALPQSRISTQEEAAGILAVNMEEWMYFKRTAWVTNATRFYYQLLFQIKDGGYKVTLRNMRYYYDEEHNGGISYDANSWITDEAALRKGGTKLAKVNGKFRTGTIDRKDALFKAAYKAAGASTK